MRNQDMDVARTDTTSGQGRPRACGFLAGLSLVALVGTTALAQPPASQGSGRAAVLLPPRALPESSPIVARGVMDDALTALDRTPVRRPGTGAPQTATGHGLTGPAWLRDDPGVIPAGGSTTAAVARAKPAPGLSPRGVLPASEAADTTSTLNRGLSKLKGFVEAEPPVVPFANTATAQTPPAARPETGPRAPLQGTGPNGSPVYAGPPAWRWYGYGSVTPGTNTFAPTGEYPRASSNWYTVTQATPGAFPVPVTSPARPTMGSEPPAYVPTRTQAPPSLVGDGKVSGRAPGISPRPRPEPTTAEPATAPLPSKFSLATEPASHAGVPTMSLPPRVIPPPVAAASATPLPVQTPAPVAVAAIPPLQPIAVMPTEPARSAPAALPVKSAEGLEWQTSPDQPKPVTPGQWQSAPGR
jgi:hypothetical protein